MSWASRREADGQSATCRENLPGPGAGSTVLGVVRGGQGQLSENSETPESLPSPAPVLRLGGHQTQVLAQVGGGSERVPSPFPPLSS